MRNFLESLIQSKTETITSLRSKIQSAETADEVRSLGSQIDALQAEVDSARAQMATLDAPVGGLRPVQGAEGRSTDLADSVEYRTAFMNYVCRNVAIPSELRVDAVTMTADGSAVIPTTIMNEIVREMESYGAIYPLVRHMNVQGGVQIPVLSLKPTATWITADTATSESDKQKIQSNTYISFGYFGLECKVAQTLLVNVTTLDMFQSLFVELAVEAITKALEIAIVKGTGAGQMTGITVDARVPSANKVTLTEEEFTSWAGWKKKVFGKMKKSYRNGMFLMAQGTFDGYIDGMVDQNGQPIGRVNYGITDGETYRFGGKTVMTVEDDVIANYDDASTGDVVGIFFNPKDYAINSNMALTVVKWTDHDTNEIKNKAILICDGKLVDPNGVIIIKKGATA